MDRDDEGSFFHDDMAPRDIQMGTGVKTPLTILDTASAAVEARRETYGSPAKNFTCIAGLWDSYLKGRGFTKHGTITEEDVAQMSILVKVARLAESPDHLDSLVDIAGYAQCHEECLKHKMEGGPNL